MVKTLIGGIPNNVCNVYSKDTHLFKLQVNTKGSVFKFQKPLPVFCPVYSSLYKSRKADVPARPRPRSITIMCFILIGSNIHPQRHRPNITKTSYVSSIIMFVSEYHALT